MPVLYLCYQSVAEPLTRTQVISYLEGLAADHTQRTRRPSGNGACDCKRSQVLLLTFEPKCLHPEEQEARRRELAARGIEWHSVRYHRRLRVPATAWDVLVGCAVVWRLMLRRRDTIFREWVLHARGHVPGLMAWIVCRWTGARFIFDVRGFIAEEYADGGVLKPFGLMYCFVKWLERRLVGSADALIVLTRRARGFLECWYPHETRGKPLQVIPCCVDLRLHAPAVIQTDSNLASPLTLVYVGKLGGWYLTKEMVRFIAAAREVAPNLSWQVWTQSNSQVLEPHLARYGLTEIVSIGQAQPEQLLVKIQNAAAGLVFDGRRLGGFGVSPTKVGEYLYAGLPVVANAGIGDTDELILGPEALASHGKETTRGSRRARKGRVGVVLFEFSDAAYRDAVRALLDLLAERDIRERCREVARRQLGLQTVGWPRYLQVYRDIGQHMAQPLGGSQG